VNHESDKELIEELDFISRKLLRGTSVSRLHTPAIYFSPRRTRRVGHFDRDHEPAVFRVDTSLLESASVRGMAGSNHRPSAHHRDRRRVLSLSQNPGGAAEKESIVGGCFYSAAQGNELKRSSFPCTSSWMEPQDRTAILN
jgi:hypothetical protein